VYPPGNALLPTSAERGSGTGQSASPLPTCAPSNSFTENENEDIERVIQSPEGQSNRARWLGTKRSLYQCPFCPVDVGEIAVDVLGAIAWLLETAESGTSIVRDHHDHPGRHMLMFAPATTNPQPCNHLITSVFSPGLHSGARIVSDTTVDYDHPWYYQHSRDLHHEYSMFVWENWIFRTDRRCDPEFGRVVESERDDVLAKYSFDDTELALKVSSSAWFVERPDAFFGCLPLRYGFEVLNASQYRI